MLLRASGCELIGRVRVEVTTEAACSIGISFGEANGDSALYAEGKHEAQISVNVSVQPQGGDKCSRAEQKRHVPLDPIDL